MITRESLSAALKTASPLFESMDRRYDRMPETRCRCDTPGVCCRFLPEMTFLEALRWIDVIGKMEADRREEILRRFVAYYFVSPARIRYCPFLEDSACAIYPHRAFACRAYGAWSRRMGRRRTEQSRGERSALIKTWRRFGVTLPAEVVDAELPYCDRVAVQGTGPAPGDDELLGILREVYGLGEPLSDLQDTFETVYQSDISLLVTALALGLKKALVEKFGVIKEITGTGETRRLDRVMGKIPAGFL